jgi:hypothetical protein
LLVLRARTSPYVFDLHERLSSQAMGDFEGGPVLRAIALRAAITAAIYGFLVLLVPWPRLLTYVCIVWLCRVAIDGILGWFGMGIHGCRPLSVSTDKGRQHYLASRFVAVFIRAVLVMACGYFFGF